MLSLPDQHPFLQAKGENNKRKFISSTSSHLSETRVFQKIAIDFLLQWSTPCLFTQRNLSRKKPTYTLSPHSSTSPLETSRLKVLVLGYAYFHIIFNTLFSYFGQVRNVQKNQCIELLKSYISYSDLFLKCQHYSKG